MADLADRIHELLKERGISQAQLSQRSKVPSGTLGDILNRRQTTTNQDHLFAISRTLGTTMEYLTAGAGLGTRPDDLMYLLTDDEMRLLVTYRTSRTAKKSLDTHVQLLEAKQQPHPQKRAKERRAASPR